MRTTILGLFLLAALPGCGLLGPDSTEGFGLFTDREAYAVADTVRVWFRNEAREPASLELCNSLLEREVGPAWVPVPNDGACPLILLAPSTDSIVGRTLVLQEYVEADQLRSGTYRLRGTVIVNQTRRQLVSNAFQINE